MNNSKKDTKRSNARKKRRKINLNDFKSFKNFSSDDLIFMLSDKNPQKRTIAATLLNEEILEGVKDKKYIISSLSESFKGEKALYSRIAISKSLVSYGELAVPYLIRLLCLIGNNQEKELPKKYFNKKSFPLPRDFAARTLAKIGNVATPYLIEVLNEDENNISDNFKKEQALDAIGSIAYKYDDHRAYGSINNLLIKTISSDDIYGESTKILIWKITRSLSGFKNNINALNLVINILKRFGNVNEIQWEGIRSIGQIGIINGDVEDIFHDISSSSCHYDNYVNSQIELSLNVSKDSLGCL